MKVFNHIAGGMAFTGIFSSFHDVNIFQKPQYLGAVVFLSVLPDIDHTQSIIGKIFLPISKRISIAYGHRTITHGIFFFLSLVILISALEKIFIGGHSFQIISIYALASHIIFDCCTKQGVPILYPFSRRAFVIPDNPSLRLSASDYRSEAVIFIVFCATIMFCRPLFANGFWTQYNKTFMTWDHIERESNRTKKAIEVTFKDKFNKSKKGIFIKSLGSKLVLLDKSKNFLQLQDDEYTPTEFYTTPWKVYETQKQLVNVSADSLNKWLSLPCVSAQIQSQTEFFWYDSNILKNGKFTDLSYKKGVSISVNFQDFETVKTQIKLKALQRSEAQRHYEHQMKSFFAPVALLSKLESELISCSDFRRGELFSEIKNIKSQIATAIEPIKPNLTEYNLQIQLLKQSIKQQTINANLTYISIK